MLAVRGHILTLGRHTLVYGVSSAALQAVGLVTLPIFARHFSPAQFGVLEIALICIAATTLLGDLGLSSAAQRSWFDHGDDAIDGRRAVISTALAATAGWSLVIAAAMVAFRAPIAAYLLHDRAHGTVIALAGIAVPLTVAGTMLREVMRLTFRPWHYAVSTILGAIVNAVLAIYLVTGTSVGVEGVLWGVVAGNTFAVCYGAVVCHDFLAPRFSLPELRLMMTFALGVLPAGVAMWGLAFLDRVMLSRIANLGEVGQYGIASRFALVLMFGITAFGLAFSPYIMSVWARDPEMERQLRARALVLMTAVLTTGAVGLSLFSREVATLIAPAFDEAYRVVPILAFGIALFGISQITMTGISLARRTRYFAMYAATATAVNVVLNLVLIPPLGGAGAAIATATAYGMLAVLYYWQSQQLYPTPFEPLRVSAIVAAGVAVAPLGLLPLGGVSVAAKAAGLAVYGVVVWRLVQGGHVPASLELSAP